MRTPRVGELLLATGAVVGVIAVVGLVVGFEPSKLPPALLNIAVYKLTFGAAAGLLAAGAVVRRYAKRHEDAQRPGGLTAGSHAPLGEGPAHSAMRREQNARARRRPAGPLTAPPHAPLAAEVHDRGPSETGPTRA